MRQEIRNIKRGKRELRNFGITLGAVLGLLGGVLLWRERGGSQYLLLAGALFVVFGLLLPALLKPVYKTWMTLAVIMGWVMTRVILGVLFYLLVTPIGLTARLLGKDMMDIRFDHAASRTYWIKKAKGPRDPKDYERQF